jgi:hypothetical protein
MPPSVTCATDGRENEEKEFAIAGALHRWTTEGEYVQKKGDSSLGQWARDVAVRCARGKMTQASVLTVVLLPVRGI